MAWNVITDFGDSAAMLPAAVLLFAWLVLHGQTRAAMLWGGLFAAQAGLIAASKIAFKGWGVGVEALDFTGVSGHAALACSVIPIAASVIAERAGRRARLLAAACGLAAGLLIGVSRVALAQHSWSEALVGCALGGGVAGLFIALSDTVRRPARVPGALIAGALAALVLLMHGAHAPSERILTRIALHLSGHSTPYMRWSYREPWAMQGAAADQSRRMTAMRSITRLLLGAALAGSLSAGAMAGERDPWLWPFAASSEWNTPIGSGARFADANAPISRDVLAGGAIINAGVWSHPLYLAKVGDPPVDVFDAENDRHFFVQVPVDAKPDPKTDAHMYVVDPTKRTVLEMYAAKPTPTGWTTARSFQVDLHGTGMHMTDGKFPGIRAMNASGMGGLIRAWELREGRIAHATTFLLPPNRLKHGAVWPSSREDYWGFRDYKGQVPIGTLIAIPPGVDIAAIGLSRGGEILARSLQDYGAYCDDSSGFAGITLSAEGASEGLPELDQMRADFGKIHKLLLPVVNNTEATPGGGGAPRQPPAPPLAQ